MKPSNEERQRQEDILRHHANERRKRRNAGIKAAETKGAEEMSRAAKMAAFTKQHGKDVENPYRRPPTETEQRKAERKAKLAQLAEQLAAPVYPPPVTPRALLRAGTMRAWIKRRRVKGVEPTADDIWNHIHKTWPTIKGSEAEAIFQEVGK